jgi:2-polyprenyl-3-methyl-5-hydroxy-6-metoxy-1,4-benzoquinol methylase
MRMMRPTHDANLLDVGCGTGHFSRRFAAAGLCVTGIDSDEAMLAFAAARDAARRPLQRRVGVAQSP